MSSGTLLPEGDFSGGVELKQGKRPIGWLTHPGKYTYLLEVEGPERRCGRRRTCRDVEWVRVVFTHGRYSWGEKRERKNQCMAHVDAFGQLPELLWGYIASFWSACIIKGFVRPKMKMMATITHSHVIAKLYDLLYS